MLVQMILTSGYVTKGKALASTFFTDHGIITKRTKLIECIINFYSKINFIFNGFSNNSSAWVLHELTIGLNTHKTNQYKLPSLKEPDPYAGGEVWLLVT